jgi:hypothetical protein
LTLPARQGEWVAFYIRCVETDGKQALQHSGFQLRATQTEIGGTKGHVLAYCRGHDSVGGILRHPTNAESIVSVDVASIRDKQSGA